MNTNITKNDLKEIANLIDHFPILPDISSHKEIDGITYLYDKDNICVAFLPTKDYEEILEWKKKNQN